MPIGYIVYLPISSPLLKIHFPKNHTQPNLPHCLDKNWNPSWSNYSNLLTRSQCCQNIQKLGRCSKRTYWLFGTYGCRSWSYVVVLAIELYPMNLGTVLYRYSEKKASKESLKNLWQLLCKSENLNSAQNAINCLMLIIVN